MNKCGVKLQGGGGVNNLQLNSWTKTKMKTHIKKEHSQLTTAVQSPGTQYNKILRFLVLS